MTLLDLIRDRPRRRQRQPSYPQAWLCPVNQTQCGHTCFMRDACHTQPAKVRALVDRLDVQTERAMVEYVMRLRQTN